MSAITVIGVDLAKNTFQLHGVDANGKVRSGPGNLHKPLGGNSANLDTFKRN